MPFDCARIPIAKSLAPSRETRGATTEPTHEEARAEADARLATHVSRASSIVVLILGNLKPSPPLGSFWDFFIFVYAFGDFWGIFFIFVLYAWDIFGIFLDICWICFGYVLDIFGICF